MSSLFQPIDAPVEIVDENGNEVLPTDDDYEFYKAEYESTHNPLSDDYTREEYRQEDF